MQLRGNYIGNIQRNNVRTSADSEFVSSRILYYMNYLAEEEYIVSDGATRTYNIAPGCRGTRAAKRCTLGEFLLYIWTG